MHDQGGQGRGLRWRAQRVITHSPPKPPKSQDTVEPARSRAQMCPWWGPSDVDAWEGRAPSATQRFVLDHQTGQWPTQQPGFVLWWALGVRRTHHRVVAVAKTTAAGTPSGSQRARGRTMIGAPRPLWLPAPCKGHAAGIVAARPRRIVFPAGRWEALRPGTNTRSARTSRRWPGQTACCPHRRAPGERTRLPASTRPAETPEPRAAGSCRHTLDGLVLNHGRVPPSSLPVARRPAVLPAWRTPPVSVRGCGDGGRSHPCPARCAAAHQRKGSTLSPNCARTLASLSPAGRVGVATASPRAGGRKRSIAARTSWAFDWCSRAARSSS